jgi:hypothetical protein
VCSLKLPLESVKANTHRVLQGIGIVGISCFIGMATELVIRVNTMDLNSIRVLVGS